MNTENVRALSTLFIFSCSPCDQVQCRRWSFTDLWPPTSSQPGCNFISSQLAEKFIVSPIVKACRCLLPLDRAIRLNSAGVADSLNRGITEKICVEDYCSIPSFIQKITDHALGSKSRLISRLYCTWASPHKWKYFCTSKSAFREYTLSQKQKCLLIQKHCTQQEEGKSDPA